MSPCPSVELLTAYLHDRVDPVQAEEIELHSEHCLACQDQLAGIVQQEQMTPWNVPRGEEAVRDSWIASTALINRLRAHVDGSERDTSAPIASETSTPAELPQVPGYAILRILGRGGMGVVYEAEQVDLKRRVALKMLHAGAGSEEMAARFQREAEHSAKLAHPNVVRIHAVGQSGGLPFLTLELVEGGSLADRLGQGPVPADVAARILEQVARGVHYAHQQGIIHRDLKPANILLQWEAGKEEDWTACTPRVADFGLARSMSESERLTQTGMLLGTPCYMAPEQTREKGTLVGPATDVHALGTILYEMLTGRPPFLGMGQVETMLAVVNVEPVPPRRLNPSAPADLETICLRCLEKDPGKRYPGAGELADDLGRFLRGEPIVARPVRPWQRAWKWARRHPTVAGLLALVCLLILGGGTLVTYLWINTAQALHQTEVERGRTARTLSEKLLLLADNNYAQGKGDEAREHLMAIPEDHRGAAWRRLKRHVDAERGRLHVDAFVRDLSFSPDGRYLAASVISETDNVWLWERASGRLLFKHTALVSGLFFQPDTQQLNVVGVVDISNREKRHIVVERLHLDGSLADRRVIPVPGDHHNFQLFPEPRKLVSLRGQNIPADRPEILIWNLDNGQRQCLDGFYEECHLDGKGEEMLALRQSTAGEGQAGSTNLDCFVFNLRENKLERTFRMTRAFRLVFSPDLRRYLPIERVGPTGGLPVRMLEIQTDRVAWERLLPGPLRGWQFSTDGTRLCGSDRNERIFVLDTATGAEILGLRGHKQPINRVHMSPDGRWLATADAGKEIRIWAIEDDR